MMFSNGSVALSSTIKGEGFLIALPPTLLMKRGSVHVEHKG